MQPTDSTGRPVMVGDLLRCDHFTAARRRKVYLYKIAVKVGDDLRVCEDGKHWYAIDAREVVTKWIDKAHKCRLDAFEPFEIIDGPSVMKPDGLECWWERKRVKD